MEISNRTLLYLLRYALDQGPRVSYVTNSSKLQILYHELQCVEPVDGNQVTS